MKKRTLKSLKLNKELVSNFNSRELIGGVSPSVGVCASESCGPCGLEPLVTDSVCACQ